MPRELALRCNSVSLEIIRWVEGAAQFLLLQRATALLHGQWCHVAGGVEEGETAWQAAVRELREETGLVPLEFCSAGFSEQFYREDWDALVLAPLFVAIVSSQAEVRLNAEHQRFRWCTVEEALAPLPCPNQRACVRHVQAEFVERQPPAAMRPAPA